MKRIFGKVYLFSVAFILAIPLVFFPHVALATEYTFTSIDVTNSTVTQAYGINNSGDIVGLYHDATGGHGFLYVGGSFTPTDVPGSSLTYAYGINNSGNIVGYYSGTTGGGYQGFLDVGGNFTTINVPGAINTYAYGINDSGDIVGVYSDAGGAEHGFLYAGGNFTTVDVPGSTLTRAFGINDSGDIVGTYNDVMDAMSVGHGFVASPVPEPATMLLLASGMMGLAGLRKKWRSV